MSVYEPTRTPKANGVRLRLSMKRLLRPIFNKIASLLGIPSVYERLNSLEEYVSPSGLRSDMFTMLERRITDLVMAQFSALREEMITKAQYAENRLTSLNEALVSYVDAKQGQNDEKMAEFTRLQSDAIAELKQSLDTIRRLVTSSSSISTPDVRTTANSEFQVIDDAMYVALENHFRGSRDLIARRQHEYLPMLPTSITATTPLIDLGCGRGEWLKVVQANGISAIGVDSNAVCVAECKEENLEVIQSDLLDFLNKQPDKSVGTYTLFQVLEHLPFPILVEVLREMRRTLVLGGRVIAEVPNAKNLRVSAGTFWIDPTHQRPLFPELLLFLASEVGFSHTDGHYTNNLSPAYDLSGLPEGATNALQSVIDAVDGPADFALIATA